MKLKEAMDCLHQERSDDPIIPLYTPWGEAMAQSGTEAVWQEYPRPQLERDHFRILNGKWSCWFEPVSGSDAAPAKQEILVPFSPESLLSGIGRQLQPDEYLWYEKSIDFTAEELARRDKGMRCILHFGAADQQAVVYCNGREVVSHVGGYLPFSAEITEFVSESPCLLQVRIRDESDASWHSRGKQTLKRGGIFYTAQSGLWQTVWYEWVPANYIQGLKITPDPDNLSVTVELRSPKEFSSVSCTVYRAADYLAKKASGVSRHTPSDAPAYNVSNDPGTTAAQDTPNGSRTATRSPAVQNASGSPRRTPSDAIPGDRTVALIGVSIQRESSAPNVLRLILPEDSIRLWSPETPYLYSFTIIADNDRIHSYFALRSYTVEPDEKGTPRFCLNHVPCFLHGLLDQGYWSDGLMTAPCDEAFVYDIELAKQAGFNMLRKHVKIEPLRWYYHCDRLGMIVWQDMVCGGSNYSMPLVCYVPTVFPHISRHTRDSHYKLFSRADEEGRKAWEQECLDTVEHLYNAPSVAVWVPFNEGWGQFDAARIAKLVRERDPSRPVDHASGWFDQKGGDFRSIHNYYRPLKVKLDKKRAYAITEYGGYACHVPGHSSVERVFGYRKFDTVEEFETAYRHLIDQQLLPLCGLGLSCAVYTQLSDVEEEVNGLVTYDRRVVKITIK